MLCGRGTGSASAGAWNLLLDLGEFVESVDLLDGGLRNCGLCGMEKVKKKKLIVNMPR